jgi:hypothetical protein
MRNRFGSQKYGVGLPQNGPSGLRKYDAGPQNSRARLARLAGKARPVESGRARRTPESPEAFFNNQLSILLPDVIDKLTPNGKVEAGGIDQLLKMFQGKMGA